MGFSKECIVCACVSYTAFILFVLSATHAEKMGLVYGQLEAFRRDFSHVARVATYIPALAFICTVGGESTIPPSRCNDFLYVDNPMTLEEMDARINFVERAFFYPLKLAISVFAGGMAIGAQVVLSVLAPFVPLPPMPQPLLSGK